MAIPLWAALAGAGLVKSELIDRPKEKRERTLAAETQRYSPWTGMQAGAIDEADPFGAALQGGMTGLGMGQNMESAADAKKLQEAQLENLAAQKGVYEAMAKRQGSGGAQSPMLAAQNPTMSYWSRLGEQQPSVGRGLY